jgi:regulation of enolase protein 1 (concanavalin A-like superfamily)
VIAFEKEAAYMNLFDKCSGKNLGSDFNWMNEPDEWRFSADNSLIISAPPLADFFQDPAKDSIKESAPFLYTTVKDNFILTTKVDVDMNNKNDSGCLMIMADKNHWAKLCYEDFDNEPSIISVVTKNKSDDCISYAVGKTKPYLRIARYGNSFAFHYSLDAKKWRLVRYFGMVSADELKVGVVAQSPVGEGCTVTFDYFDISPNTDRDIRVVVQSFNS